MEFGAHLNASTSFDQTIYKLSVPTDDISVLEQSFRVLRDWASELSFLSKEIEKERKVGLEELRQGRTGRRRVSEQLLPSLYYKSLHSHRIPIGTVESLMNFEHEALIRFYQDWYQPQHMAVICVGDISVEKIKELVHRYFDDWFADPKAPVREDNPLVLHEERIIAQAFDDEIPYPSATIVAKFPTSPVLTEGDYVRQNVLPNLAFIALNERLRYLSLESGSPILSARVGTSMLSTTFTAHTSSVTFAADKVDSGIRHWWTELCRFRRFGITESEFARAKRHYVASLEMNYDERNKTPSTYYTDDLLRMYTEQVIIQDIARELELVRTVVPCVSLQMVNDFASQFLPDHSQVLHFIASDQEQSPSVEELEVILSQTERVELAPPDSATEIAEILEQPPSDGSITQIAQYENLGIEEWTFANGARVLLKATENQQEQILFGATGQGGASIFPVNQAISAKYSSEIAYLSGAGGHSFEELDKLMAGVRCQLRIGVGNYHHHLQGYSHRDDLETFLKLFWIQTQQASFEKNAFDRAKELHRNMLRNQYANPEVCFRHQFARILWGDHLLHQPSTVEQIDQIDLSDAQGCYQRLWHSAAGMTFVVVGPFEATQLKKLLSRYIGGLAKSQRLALVSNNAQMVAGQITQECNHGIEPKARYRLYTYCELCPDDDHRFALNFIHRMLRERLRKALREERGDTYSVQVQCSHKRLPIERLALGIEFVTSPDVVNELSALSKNILVEFAEHGPTQAELDVAKAQLISLHQQSVQSDQYWLARISQCIKMGFSLTSLENFEDRVEKMSGEKVHETAALILNSPNQIELTMLPEHG